MTETLSAERWAILEKWGYQSDRAGQWWLGAKTGGWMGTEHEARLIAWAHAKENRVALLNEALKTIQDTDRSRHIAIYSDDPRPGWIARFSPHEDLNSQEYHILETGAEPADAAWALLEKVIP